jgi:large subunit ribosomal protein L31
MSALSPRNALSTAVHAHTDAGLQGPRRAHRKRNDLKTAIQPTLTLTTVTCAACGTSWHLRTAGLAASVDVCAACHPAYTGEERRQTRGSRTERFERLRRLAEEHV